MKKEIIIKVLFFITLGLLALCSCNPVKPIQSESTISIQADILSMSNKQLVIDRFEGDFAVCEDENLKMINIKKSLIPINAPEGAVLIIHDGVIEYDEKETIIRMNRSQELLHSLFEKNNK